MTDPTDLRRFIESGKAFTAPKPQGSGYAIGMPDGKGGHQQVPVELAACLLLDMAVNVLMRIEQKLDAMNGKEETSAGPGNE